MESASSMLKRVEPILKREYPHMPVDIRDDVLGSLPYRAGMAEAYFLLLKELYTPDMRLQVWIGEMRNIANEILSKVSATN